MKRRTALLLCALALGAIVSSWDWPAPDFLRRKVLAEAAARMERPVGASSVRVSLLGGVILRDVAVGETWPRLRASRVNVPWRDAGSIRVDDLVIHAERDAKGILRLPWPALALADRPASIRFDSGLIFYRDRPLGVDASLGEVAGEIRPRAQEGTVSARWRMGAGVPIEVSWIGGDGRLALGKVATAWSRAADTRAGVRIDLRPAEAGRPGFAGRILDAPNRWEAQIRGEKIPGSLLDAALDGARIRGPIDLDASWSSPAARGRVGLRGRGGVLAGVAGFRTLAAQAEAPALAEPGYEEIELEAALAPGRMEIERAHFEGEGLGIRFSGELREKEISGRLTALFSPSLADRIPKIRDNADLLDREEGRIRVAFRVSGSLEAPHLETIPPPAHRLLLRGTGRFLRRGFGVLTAPLDSLSGIFSRD